MSPWHQLEVTACPTCDGWREINATHCIACHERMRRPPILVKRPVAFRVPRVVDDKLSDTEWQLFASERAASASAEAKGCDYQALFVRDGTAIIAEWETVETAPADIDVQLGWVDWHSKEWVQKVGCAKCTKGGWLDGQATHWMPLAAPPRIKGPVGTPSTTK